MVTDGLIEYKPLHLVNEITWENIEWCTWYVGNNNMYMKCSESYMMSYVPISIKHECTGNLVMIEFSRKSEHKVEGT